MLKRKRNAAILLKKWLIFQVQADSIFAVCPSIIIVLGRQLRTPSTYYWTIFTNRISSTNILLVILHKGGVVGGARFPQLRTFFTLDIWLSPGSKLPAFFGLCQTLGVLALWLLHFGYRLQSYSSSSFVLHSPFPHNIVTAREVAGRGPRTLGLHNLSDFLV